MDEDALERTAVHESGHAVIAYHLGLTLIDIELESEFIGSTSIKESEPHDVHVMVAVAGYAAVGAVLGAGSELTNRNAEHHADGKTDMERAMEHAGQIPGISDIQAYVDGAFGEVRDLIRVSAIYASVHVLGEELFEGAAQFGLPRRMLAHDAVRVIAEAAQEVGVADLEEAPGTILRLRPPHSGF